MPHQLVEVLGLLVDEVKGVDVEFFLEVKSVVDLFRPVLLRKGEAVDLEHQHFGLLPEESDLSHRDLFSLSVRIFGVKV